MTLYSDLVRKSLYFDMAGGEENNAAVKYREEKR